MIEDKEYFKKHKYRAPADYLVRAFVLPKLEFIRRCGCLKDGINILDVGSGNGTFGWHLAKYTDNVMCVDNSSQLLKDNPCKFKIKGSAYQLPFPDGRFYMTFEANMLHHLDHPYSAIEEMFRCSSKYIVIIEPNRYNPLMFLFSCLVSSESGVRGSFRKKWEEALRNLGCSIAGCVVTGMITQENTPKAFVPFLRLFDFNFWLGEYIIIIGKKPDDR
jgi:ubiquinone/menaquinone biosynthesis C-methylase UbiE